MRRTLDDVAEEVEREVQKCVPEYSRPADDTYMRTLRSGVVDALGLFIERIADPGRGWERVARAYQQIGRGEAVEGRSLDTLQAALRLGSRVAWRRMGELAEDMKLEPHIVAALGEAAFVHMHEIAEAATTGHTEELLRGDGELQRRRKRLLDLLLADPPASPEAVQELAHAARWPLPRRVAVIALHGPAGLDGREEDGMLLPAGVLADTGARPARLLVPDPDGPGPSRGRVLLRALRERPAAIGPTVPLGEAARSLRWATRALTLVRRGVLPPGTGVVRCSDHLPTLLLYADEPLLRALGLRVLAPLAAVSAPQRDRLAETLLAWLQSGNSVGDVAARLHVHPQTVRYRLRQLEKLFGDRLRDPESRFELELALRAQAADSVREERGERAQAHVREAAASTPSHRLPSAGR
ncbi:PucR family transcriptional regulator [Streptomyces sp. NPDC052236]|uniref:PucR family transcriptional regulator n=1 Tax=Streptomyces sp. NPDC052236 TaxID=3365686 RepID=UPI0037CD34CE